MFYNDNIILKTITIFFQRLFITIHYKIVKNYLLNYDIATQDYNIMK